MSYDDEESVGATDQEYFYSLWTKEKEMSYIKAVISYDKARDIYSDDFAKWLMDSDRMICNGDMLLSYMEDGESFEEFMNEQHPEYEVE